VGDAEIIPIGTRGRPGRGSGTARPSSSARDLAGGGRAKPPAKPVDDHPDETTDESSGESTEESSGPVALPRTAPPPRKAAPPKKAPSPSEGPAPVPAARTAERAPLGGVTPGEWLGAFQFAAKEVFGDDWEPQLASLLAFLRRRVTGEYAVDEYGFDAEVTDRFLMTALRPLAEKWFRIDVTGAENIPTEGGALVVSNHSGTLPMDALMTLVTVHDATGRHLRPLGADLVFRMPVVSSMARKGGATLACNEDAERMLAGGELVGVWPEGFKGIGKPYAERYKLQRFGRGGFVSAALRTQVPIVPLSVVGAEEIYPLVGNLPSLARLLGVPYVPITPFFPWLGPLGLVPLPSKWLMEFGEPIRTDEFEDGAADDPMLVFNVTDQVRETIQQTLYTLLMQRDTVFGRNRAD
jgi:1-acyl-sn-glycerol-3-phosphate acyltransferase